MKKILTITTLLLLSFIGHAMTYSEGMPIVSMTGRKVSVSTLVNPAINVPCQGTVTVDIWVDIFGNVKLTEISTMNSTVTDTRVLMKAREAARNIRFDQSISAPDLQRGNVVYTFNQSDSSNIEKSTDPNAIRFMGVPVDGTLENMLTALQLKGFTVTDRTKGFLKGQFNGQKVDVGISTNHGKVDRVMVMFPQQYDTYGVWQQYNALLNQFDHLDKYANSSHTPYLTYKQEYTADDERRSSAVYVLKNETYKQTPSAKVWFRFSKGRVYLYYDNVNNRPNGEDL